MEHPLHEAIGDIFTADLLPGYEILKDPACANDGQNIPLFCSEKKSNQTEYCDVDLLIVKSNKIRVIIEIEEANIKPTQICGKFLTSALSSCYIGKYNDNNPVNMDDAVLFIQILDTSNLEEGTHKIEQWRNIEESITQIIPVGDSKIRKYSLFYGEATEFSVNGEKKEEFIKCIREFLSSQHIL
ncbi:hypothetical protein LCGC14_0616560 [marine sediment metagenome]|uniref:Type I restriction enzyme R protein N-terminal domain-containing protein n=1 Tax=marine sediment metagenome TaxID=412755 RepID=A0A0F9UEK8_9ZZZZ|nr:hypothetical protein [Candidatus Aminicenantes bacterium]